MTAEHFQENLIALLDARPFVRFVIELNTGQRYEIGHPHLAAFSEGAGVLLTPGQIPVFFDHESVHQLIISPAHSAPGKRRSK